MSKTATSQKGQVALPVILLISSVIVEIAIAGSFVSYFLSTGGLGSRLSQRAEAAAMSGIRDALIKITRNKEFGSTSYSMDLIAPGLGDSVQILVSRDPQPQFYLYTITATGIAGSRQKKIEATVTVSRITGQVQLQSLVERQVQ